MSRNYLQENIQLTNSKIQLPCGTIVPIFFSNLLSIIYKVRTFSVCSHFYQYRVQFTMCDNFSVDPCLQLSMNWECSVSIDKSRIPSIWFPIFLILAIRNLIIKIESRGPLNWLLLLFSYLLWSLWSRANVLVRVLIVEIF